jgi:hypothetical protein
MRRHQLITLVAAAIAALGLAAGAWAWLSSHGSGSGSGTTHITLSGVTVTGATANQSLLPTGTATGDINLTLTNGNTSRVHISSLALDTSQGTNGFSSNASGCALSFATQTNGGNGWTLAANGSTSVDLTNSVTMGTTAASACQGKSFTVYLKAS